MILQRVEPPILKALEELYERERKKVEPLYPFDKKTGKIELPEEDVITDLKFFLVVGNRPAAVKRVTELTGAGLRVSKDYVDRLQWRRLGVRVRKGDYMRMKFYYWKKFWVKVDGDSSSRKSSGE